MDGARVLRCETHPANSHNTESILRREWNVPPERFGSSIRGVDTRRFVPAARDDAVRTRLGWGTGRVVLTVGRLQKRKGRSTHCRIAGNSGAVPWTSSTPLSATERNAPS